MNYEKHKEVNCINCNDKFYTLKSNIKRNIGYCKKCKNKKIGDSLRKYTTKEEIELYKRFTGIKNRCFNKKDKMYKYYGAVGVTVCDEWLKNPSSFISWSLENGFSSELEIDKDYLCDKLNISPKIYSPDTCLWTTKNNNISISSTNRYIEYKNNIKSLEEWCKELNLNRNTISTRLNVLKWNIERSFETPTTSKEKEIIQFDKNMNLINIYKSSKIASKETLISKTSICNCVTGKSKTAGGFIWKLKEI